MSEIELNFFRHYSIRCSNDLSYSMKERCDGDKQGHEETRFIVVTTCRKEVFPSSDIVMLQELLRYFVKTR